MKVLVLGAGVIGVTTAFELLQAGHEVAVLEQEAGVALQTSHANAAQLSAGYAAPWAGPGVPIKALKWLCMKDGPLRLRCSPERDLYRWLLGFLRHCTRARYVRSRARMMALAAYSLERLAEIRAAGQIEFAHQQGGTLQIFRSAQEFETARADASLLETSGGVFEPLDVSGCVAAEPALARSRVAIAGGLRMAGDETGDCHLFTEALARKAGQFGARFHFRTRAKALIVRRGHVAAVRTTAGELDADAYVVALGCASRPLLLAAGLSLPVHPVRGYSLTFPHPGSRGGAAFDGHG